MHPGFRRWPYWTAVAVLIATHSVAGDISDIDLSVAPIASAFERDVDRKLSVPPEEQTAYIGWLEAALAHAGLSDLAPQYVLIVDRGPAVQAALLYWKGAAGWHFIGASPVSTGRPGGFEHFLTPVGVFELGDGRARLGAGRQESHAAADARDRSRPGKIPGTQGTPPWTVCSRSAARSMRTRSLASA